MRASRILVRVTDRWWIALNKLQPFRTHVLSTWSAAKTEGPYDGEHFFVIGGNITNNGIVGAREASWPPLPLIRQIFAARILLSLFLVLRRLILLGQQLPVVLRPIIYSIERSRQNELIFSRFLRRSVRRGLKGP